MKATCLNLPNFAVHIVSRYGRVIPSSTLCTSDFVDESDVYSCLLLSWLGRGISIAINAHKVNGKPGELLQILWCLCSVYQYLSDCFIGSNDIYGFLYALWDNTFVVIWVSIVSSSSVYWYYHMATYLTHFKFVPLPKRVNLI